MTIYHILIVSASAAFLCCVPHTACEIVTRSGICACVGADNIHKIYWRKRNIHGSGGDAVYCLRIQKYVVWHGPPLIRLKQKYEFQFHKYYSFFLSLQKIDNQISFCKSCILLQFHTYSNRWHIYFMQHSI